MELNDKDNPQYRTYRWFQGMIDKKHKKLRGFARTKVHKLTKYQVNAGTDDERWEVDRDEHLRLLVKLQTELQGEIDLLKKRGYLPYGLVIRGGGSYNDQKRKSL